MEQNYHFLHDIAFFFVSADMKLCIQLISTTTNSRRLPHCLSETQKTIKHVLFVYDVKLCGNDCIINIIIVVYVCHCQNMVICIWSCADVLVCKETGKFAGDVASEYLIWNSFSLFSSTAEALHNLHVCYCCSECGPPSLYKCMTESTFIEDTHS